MTTSDLHRALLGVGVALSIGLCIGSAGCHKKKPGLTPAQRCAKGCEFRVTCIEEMALEKAMTEANRAHIKRSQKKSHKRFVDFCYKACSAAKPRFQAFARCGTESKSCTAYFDCESAALEKLRSAREQPRPR